MRILIVDDHEIVRRGVRALLTASDNFEVCGEAADGREAIQKAETLKPDAIIMDISMPRLNGLEATREIRSVLPDTRIIVLSQHDVPEMVKQAAAVGAHAYVVKTAISTDLPAALDRVQQGESFPADMLAPLTPDLDVQEILRRSVAFERALRETGERLSLAQQVARVGTFEYNLRTGVHRWTPEMEALYGLPAGAFRGSQTAWSQLLHPEDREETLAAMERAAESESGGFEGEWRVIWPDGSVHSLLGRCWLFRDETGRPERWVGANIDITERKRSEDRAEKLARLLDLSFDAIVVRDTWDRVRYWNRGAQELYGWSAEEANGQVTHTLLQTSFPTPLDDIFATLRKDGRWEGELEHSCKDGRRVTVNSRWALIRDWESGKLWVMETNTDISARKAAERELRKAVEGSRQLVVGGGTATVGS